MSQDLIVYFLILSIQGPLGHEIVIIIKIKCVNIAYHNPTIRNDCIAIVDDIILTPELIFVIEFQKKTSITSKISRILIEDIESICS